jgi:hypothetical protein
MLFRKKIKPQFTITIPEPCNEDWKQMRVVDSCHRNCAACDRVLTDFAQMNDDELVLFFSQSKGKVCGRFRKDQLNRPITGLPEKTTKAVWWKAAALLPLTLFSKNTNAQQLHPDSAQTEQVPFIAQTDSVHPFIAVAPAIKWDSLIVARDGWPWQPYEYVGIPMIVHDYHFDWDLVCTTMPYSLAIEPPPTESALGLIAAGPGQPASVAPKRSAGAAKYFGALIAPDPNG